MKTQLLLIASAVGWSSALLLTVVASMKPSLAIVAGLWAVLALGVGATSSVVLTLQRAQYEVVEDVRLILAGRDGKPPLSPV